MLRPKPSMIAAAGLVVLVAALLAGALEGFLPHTDDGCPTEIHCVACRNVQGRTALIVRAAAPLPIVAITDALPSAPSRRLLRVARPPQPSRGPPSSS